MSKLDELIAEHCPDGVEFWTLGEIGDFYGGLSGKSKADFKDGNAKYITYKNVFGNIAVNTDISDFVQVGAGESQNTVQEGDVIFTGSSETPDECGMSSVLTQKIDEKLYLNSFCFGFRLRDANTLLPSFSKFLFRSFKVREQIGKTASGVTRFNVSKEKMKRVLVPIPPLPVQREVVRILDKFTELTTELTAELAKELAARKKQYAYYRDKLLTFGDNVPVVALGEVAEIGTGSKNTADGLPTGLYPFFVRSQEVRYMDTYEFDETAIITSGDGVGVGKIFHFINGKYALHQRAYRIKITDGRVNPKFVFYYMKSHFSEYMKITAVHASVTSVRKPMLDKYPIHLPPIEEQERIAAILDRFETLTADISSGLPAEIALRKKQYEYYRDKLLTFKVSG